MWLCKTYIACQLQHVCEIRRMSDGDFAKQSTSFYDKMKLNIAGYSQELKTTTTF